jgi:hypothetical protein
MATTPKYCVDEDPADYTTRKMVTQNKPYGDSHAVSQAYRRARSVEPAGQPSSLVVAADEV